MGWRDGGANRGVWAPQLRGVGVGEVGGGCRDKNS